MGLRSEARPLLLGYHSACRSLPDEHVRAVRVALTDWAAHNGYDLAGLFAELAQRPSVELQALIITAHRRDVRTVAVPALADLGPDERIQTATWGWLEEAGLHIVIVGKREDLTISVDGLGAEFEQLLRGAS